MRFAKSDLAPLTRMTKSAEVGFGYENSNIITAMEQEQKTMQEKSDWLSGRHTRDTAKLARQYHERLQNPSNRLT